MNKNSLVILLLIILGAWLSGAVSISINYILLKQFFANVIIALLSSTGTLLHKED